MRRHALLLSLLVLAALGWTSPAQAATCDRYAAPFGSDSAAGTESLPLRSAQALADRLMPGQTGCLMGGVYAQEVTGPYVLRVGRGGAPGAPVTIRSVPGQRATLRGIVYVPEHSDHVTLSHLNFDARRATPDKTSGIQIMSADVTISDSDITNHRAAICMVLGSPGWGEAVRTVLTRNVFHDCGWQQDNKEHAVYVEMTAGVRITDNLFLRSGAYAVHLYPMAQGTTVTNNVMVDNGGGVVFAGEAGVASSDNVVKRNIITGSWMRPGIHSSWGAVRGQRNLAADNCLFDNPRTHVDISNGGFTSDRNVIASPEFRDAQAGDYRLAADSQCLDIVGYDTARLLRGETSPEPTPTPTPVPTTTASPSATTPPAPSSSPTATPTPATATPTATATAAPTQIPAATPPPALATPVATVPPGGTQPEPDPKVEPVEAARVSVDEAAFSASGGSARCNARRHSRCR